MQEPQRSVGDWGPDSPDDQGVILPTRQSDRRSRRLLLSLVVASTVVMAGWGVSAAATAIEKPVSIPAEGLVG